MSEKIEKIKKQLSRGKRQQVSLSLSEDLIKRLKEYRKRLDVPSLSPMIELMLEDWLNEQEDLEKS